MNITYKNSKNLKRCSDEVIHNDVGYLAGVIASDSSADIIGLVRARDARYDRTA